MPGGIPVATVALNGAMNAGLLAARILGAKDKVIRQKMADYQEELRGQVQVKYERLERDGWKG
jgi:5-(carboxyamino)imidazole ribonucleotide mutase